MSKEWFGSGKRCDGCRTLRLRVEKLEKRLDSEDERRSCIREEFEEQIAQIRAAQQDGVPEKDDAEPRESSDGPFVD